MSNLKDFSNMKLKYKILIIAGSLFVLSSIGAGIRAYVKRREGGRAYKDKYTALAKRLFSALFPEGASSGGFSWLNPLDSTIKVVDDLFKDDANINDLMQIANDLNSDNFQKVTKAYKRLYDRDLIFDLQKQMEADYKAFDDKVTRNNSSQNPKLHDKVIKTLALSMYKNLDSWELADDTLYNQLYQMSDADFIATVNEFNKIAIEKGSNKTFRDWSDDTHTMDAYNEIHLRLNTLGIE